MVVRERARETGKRGARTRVREREGAREGVRTARTSDLTVRCNHRLTWTDSILEAIKKTREGQVTSLECVL